MESLEEGGDTLRGKVVHKVGEGSKSFDLCLKFNEETATEAMYKASNKLFTGTIFSVRINLNSDSLLSVGVKELQLKMLTVIMLKRKGKGDTNGSPNAYDIGAAEAAGLRLGDVIFGVNFAPAREGATTLQKALMKNNKFLHLQCWRCHQLCPPLPQDYTFLAWTMLLSSRSSCTVMVSSATGSVGTLWTFSSIICSLI